MFFNIRIVSFIIFIMLMFSHVHVIASSSEIVSVAGDQRMNVHMLAKEYFYVHGDVFSHKAKKNLKKELQVFDDYNKKLHSLVTGNNHKRALLKIDMLEVKYVKSLKMKNFDKAVASSVIKVSDELSELYNGIIKRELKRNKRKEAKFLESLERQAMVIEKMAKYYVAYTMGINDAETLESIKKLVNEFDNNLKHVVKQKANIPTATKDLKKIIKTWRTMKGYYTGIEESQLPAMALITTDRILKSTNNIIEIYTRQEGL